jgi:hypothetical protein
MGKWGLKLILVIRIFSTNVLAIWEKKLYSRVCPSREYMGVSALFMQRKAYPSSAGFPNRMRRHGDIHGRFRIHLYLLSEEKSASLKKKAKEKPLHVYMHAHASTE